MPNTDLMALKVRPSIKDTRTRKKLTTRTSMYQNGLPSFWKPFAKATLSVSAIKFITHTINTNFYQILNTKHARRIRVNVFMYVWCTHRRGRQALAELHSQLNQTTSFSPSSVSASKKRATHSDTWKFLSSTFSLSLYLWYWATLWAP